MCVCVWMLKYGSLRAETNWMQVVSGPEGMKMFDQLAGADVISRKLHS